MKNVITFPENQTRKVRKEQRQNTQQAILSLSMVTLIMGALLLNDSVQRKTQIYLISDNTQAEDIQQLNRAIASAQPMNPFRDLEWEKNLARRLADSHDPRKPASISKKVGSLEQIRFGVLAGRYQVEETTVDGQKKIVGFTYQETDDVTAAPVELDPQRFLKEYGDQLPVAFVNFDRANHMSQEMVQEFRLLGTKKEVLGLVSFAVDEQGKLISMKIKTSPEQ